MRRSVSTMPEATLPHIFMKAKGPDNTANEFVTESDVIRIDIEGAILEAPDGLDMPNETEMS